MTMTIVIAHSFWLTGMTLNQLHRPTEPRMPLHSPPTQGRAIGKSGLCAMMTHSHTDAMATQADLPMTTKPGEFPSFLFKLPQG